MPYIMLKYELERLKFEEDLGINIKHPSFVLKKINKIELKGEETQTHIDNVTLGFLFPEIVTH